MSIVLEECFIGNKFSCCLRAYENRCGKEAYEIFADENLLGIWTNRKYTTSTSKERAYAIYRRYRNQAKKGLM